MKPAGNGNSGIYFWGDTEDFRIIPYEKTFPGNLISGNNTSGILLSRTCSHIVISGNVIGLNRDCSGKLGNKLQGINIAAGCDSNEVAGNWIGGNGSDGIYFLESRKNTVSKNIFGTDRDQMSDLGNQGNGVYMYFSADNTLSENWIWYSGKDGVKVQGESARHNRITRNSIWQNKDRGIYNMPGANEWITPPSIQSIASEEVKGSSKAGQTVEIFSNDNGQGKSYLGSAVTDQSGTFHFSLAGLTLLTHVTVTATDASGNTSEFSSPVKTDIQKDAQEKIPHEFALRQNYPNPFNAETSIGFDVKEPCKVMIKVYDIAGKELAVLVDGLYSAGSHIVRFNAKGLSSGMYVYHVKMGDFSSVKKMVLIE
jgi:hypothetical protein